MKNVTVNEAIKKGHQWINYPVMTIMIIGLPLSTYLFFVFKQVWIFPVGFILTFMMMWLWWSIFITHWRIWAFSKVRNVHELKEKAINQKLIWEDGKWGERTEIRTFKQRKLLTELERKFELPDISEVITDDSSVPFETKIYYSKLLKWINLIIGLAMGVFGCMSIVEEEYISGCFLIGLTMVYFYFAPEYATSAPQITINEMGIKTVNTSFVEWNKVKKVKIKQSGIGRSANWYLDILFHKKDAAGNWGDELEISGFDIAPNKIERLIRIYQQRYRQRR